MKPEVASEVMRLHRAGLGRRKIYEMTEASYLSICRLLRSKGLQRSTRRALSAKLRRRILEGRYRGLSPSEIARGARRSCFTVLTYLRAIRVAQGLSPRRDRYRHQDQAPVSTNQRA